MSNTPTLDAATAKSVGEANTQEELNTALRTIPHTIQVKEPRPATMKAEEETLVSDTFIIGGEEVEITGEDAADVLRQYKAAVQAYEIGRSQTTTAEVKPAKTAEELQVEKFELENDFRAGRISADDYLEKTGAIDIYLAKKGVKLDQVTELIRDHEESKQATSWTDATDAFKVKFGESGTPWPGGGRVLDLMGKTLIELGLTDKPSVDSLKAAYDHLIENGWDLIAMGQEDAAAAKAEVKTNQQNTSSQTPAVRMSQPATPTKRKSSSAIWDVSGGHGTREVGGNKKTDVPAISDNASPREIIELFKSHALANGQNPDDLLRQGHGSKNT